MRVVRRASKNAFQVCSLLDLKFDLAEGTILEFSKVFEAIDTKNILTRARAFANIEVILITHGALPRNIFRVYFDEIFAIVTVHVLRLQFKNYNL